MRLVYSEVEELNYPSTSEGILKAIADAAHICTGVTESKRTDEEVFKDLVEKSHLRPLEFATIYLAMPKEEYEKYECLHDESYVRCNVFEGTAFVTMNARYLYELLHLNHTKEDCRCRAIGRYVCPMMSQHHKRITLHWTISRGIADEFRTHTHISSLMQSTRYCNYTKDKFGGELTFVQPSWFGHGGGMDTDFINSLANVEDVYKLMILKGMKAEQAREVLPLSIKTELLQCAFVDDWRKFFQQRTSEAAHPDARSIAKKAEEIVERLDGRKDLIDCNALVKMFF